MCEEYICDMCEIPLHPEEVYGYNGTPYCKKCYTELFKIRYFIQYKNKFKYIPPNRSSAIAISETPIFKPYTESHLVREILKNLQIIKNDYGDGAIDLGAELALKKKAKEITRYIEDAIKTFDLKPYDDNIKFYVIAEV